MDLEKELEKRYLLGTVTEAEDQEIGVRIIEDVSFAENLIQAESDLIEDYLEDSLTEQERELFESQYLITDERRERVREIALLKKYATRSAEIEAVVDVEAQSLPWWRNFKILVPAFAVVILLAVASLFFIDRGTIGGVDYAQLNRRDLRDAAVIGDAQIVQIMPGTFRSATPGSVTVVSGNSTAVLFRLPLTFSVDAGTTYEASVERQNSRVFGIPEARVYTEGSSTDVRLLTLSPCVMVE